MPPTPDKEIRKQALLLALLCAATLLPFIGETLFNTRGEPREAVVAYSMLEQRNWVLPLNNGSEFAFKPPLLHWLIAAISAAWGSVTEFTSRLPSALALAAMAIGTFVFYARRKGHTVAMLTALLTLSCFEVHRAGGACRVDMLLAALMVLSIFSLYRWHEAGCRKIPWAAISLLCATALVKGPIGGWLPLLIFFLFRLRHGHSLPRTFLQTALLAVTSVVPLCIWYAAAIAEGGPAFAQLVYEENVLRLIGKMSYTSHENPWHYNFMTLAAGLLPYTLLPAMSLCCLGKVCGKSGDAPATTGGGDNATHTGPARRGTAWPRRCMGCMRRGIQYIREMDSLRFFTLLCAVVIFAFYCIPKSKRSVYLLPMYPFTAYFLAEYMLWLCRRTAVVKWFGLTLAALPLLLTATFCAVRAGYVPDSIFSGRHAAENVAFLHALERVPMGAGDFLIVLAPVAASVWFITRHRHWGHSPKMALAATVVPVCLFWALDGFYQPTVLNVKSDRSVARQIGRIAPEGRIYSFRTDAVAGNMMHPFTINFYLGDRVVPFNAFKPARGYLIAGNDEIEAWEEENPNYVATLVRDFHHRSCDDGKYLKLYRFEKNTQGGNR